MDRVLLATLVILASAAVQAQDSARSKERPAQKEPAKAENAKSEKPAAKSEKAQPKPVTKVPVKSAPATGKNAPEAKRSAVRIPAEREAAALAFARENHPELAALLEGLKENAPKEYGAALVDLDRAVERLARTRERSAERHAVELADWKITSRIRLLAARLTMSPDPAVEAELRAALRERLELRLAAQRTERDRLQARAEKLTQQIELQQSQWDAILEKQFQELQTTLPVRAKGKVKKSDD